MKPFMSFIHVYRKNVKRVISGIDRIKKGPKIFIVGGSVVGQNTHARTLTIPVVS